MRTLVIYDTKFGNTEKVARAIAHGAGAAGSVHVMNITETGGPLAEEPDLVLVGGPTQKRGASAALRAFIDDLPTSLRGIPTGSFDTRYRGTKLLMGSAAVETARRVEKTGSRLVAAPESFFIARSGPMERQGLEPGELERAEAWGRVVATAAGRAAGAVS